MEKTMTTANRQHTTTSCQHNAKHLQPATDLIETRTGYAILMEMPGVEKKDLDIKLDKNTLFVKGTATTSAFDSMERIYNEYQTGTYARDFKISQDIDQESFSADLTDGILHITMQRLPEAAPKKIDIN